MVDIPEAAVEAAVEAIQQAASCRDENCLTCREYALDAIRAALPHLTGYKEPIIMAVRRILDECSAWIARPNREIEERIALAAGIAMMSSQSERHDQVYAAGFAAGQEAMKEAAAKAVAASWPATQDCQSDWLCEQLDNRAKAIRALPIAPPASEKDAADAPR